MNTRENGETKPSSITHEPPYDTEPHYAAEDICVMGYGFKDIEVSQIKDPRMLVNFYLFLQKDSTKKGFDLLKKRYANVVHKTIYALLISVSNHCEYAVTELGDSGLFVKANEAAKIILDNSLERGSSKLHFDGMERVIDKLVEGVQYYYYGHIESSDFDNN